METMYYELIAFVLFLYSARPPEPIFALAIHREMIAPAVADPVCLSLSVCLCVCVMLCGCVGGCVRVGVGVGAAAGAGAGAGVGWCRCGCGWVREGVI